MNKRIYIFCCLFFIGHILLAQNNMKMNIWQDSLYKLGLDMSNNSGEAERLESNSKFVKSLVSSLKEPNSFYFNFEKLKMISVINSPDNSFRIFSWSLRLQDGSFLFYGAIQHKSSTIKLTPLLDKTFEIKKPDSEIVTASNWYGARYYDIIALNKNKYILLGWKGHHAEYSKKVIEVLNVNSDGKITLGAPVFSDQKNLVRKIFSFTSQASMYLKSNTKLSRIEFDHIVPADPSLEGNYKYYGPDLSYDGYEISNGNLKFKENIDVRNPDRGDHDLNRDPLKIDSKRKSGL